ncbi:tRNA (adenosine(37)-N6)-threonylcarbamoyltransferase complex transferase subunit TsaD [Candidatus Woesebacteria bacterium]|nr:tRNA (adenosine(37)-N6)-threonylcarbamoyltransferase complex transferase subunit TsaD [Candidatus Woesebacteria bacterium]
MSNLPLVLAIDTSCDDTAAAVVHGVQIRSNIIASQTELHKPYGGVFPTVAKQAHSEHIHPAVQLALKRAGVTADQLTAIAVTKGPGLAPALEVGITYASAFALTHRKPLIAVNHIEGHILSVLAEPWRKHSVPHSVALPLPVLGVVISGGHTLFVLVHEIGSYQIIGSTLDDAAGECLDKIGRMLNLGYPAGPVIEQFAKLGNPLSYPFPLPMTTDKRANLSFSGLKTHARKLITGLQAKQQPLPQQVVYDLCASTQRGVFRHIQYKLSPVLKQYSPSEVWLGGGVAANSTLRATLRKTISEVLPESSLRVPYSKKLCADNAAMIGVVASLRIQMQKASYTQNPDREPRMKLESNLASATLDT